MNTTNTHIADAMESNGEVFLLDTSPSSGEPAALKGLQRAGTTLYALNARGHNRWWAQVQPGRDDNDQRTTDAECEAVAIALSSAPAAAEPMTQALFDQVMSALRLGRVSLEWHGRPEEEERVRAASDALRAYFTISPSPAQVQPSANAEIERLRALAATCYAGLGAECNLPDSWLDALNAAASGEPFDTEGLLPFRAQPPAVQAEPEQRCPCGFPMPCRDKVPSTFCRSKKGGPQ